MKLKSLKIINCNWLNVDFKEMTVQLSTSSLPSNAFFNNIYFLTKKKIKQHTDKKITYNILRQYLKKKDQILSYGCGSCHIEKKLLKYGLSVDCYDKAKNIALEKHKIKILNKKTQLKKYDKIFISNVFYSMKLQKIKKEISFLKSILHHNGKIFIFEHTMENLKFTQQLKIFLLNLIMIFKNYFFGGYQLLGYIRNNKTYIKIFELHKLKLKKKQNIGNMFFFEFLKLK